MKIRTSYSSRLAYLKSQKGAVIILVALLLFVLLCFTALAIDLGYRHVVQNQLQDIADGSALAAARELGSIYQDMTPAEQLIYDIDGSGDRINIVGVAQAVAHQNEAGAKRDIDIIGSEVQIGHWKYDTRTYCDSLVSDPACPPPKYPSTVQPTAVKVTVRRDTSANGAFSTFFAKIFGMDTLSAQAHAVAALTGQGTADPGELELPVGISTHWFEENEEDGFCGKTIKFSPSTDPLACAGWTTFTNNPANDPKIRSILDGLTTSPFTDTDTNFEYINGDLSEGSFEKLMTAFENHGYDVDFQYDPNNPANIPQQVADDENGAELYDDDGVTQLRYPPCSGASGCSGPPRYSHEWPTTVVVYDSDDCTPSGTIKVAGFARVVVYDVGKPSNKTVAARIDCGYVTPEPEHGGGGAYGPLAPIPQLVE